MLKSDYKFGEVINLRDQFAPEGASVGFKHLWNNDNGGVVLLTFAPGQELAEHVAPGEIMVCVAEGAIDFYVHDQAHHLEAGHFLLLGEGVTHSVKSTHGAKVVLIKVKA